MSQVPTTNSEIKASWKPVVWFLVLAYGISYISYYLRPIIDNNELDHALRMVTKFGPTIAGVIITAIVLKSNGLKWLIRKITALKVHVKWYIVALLFPILCPLIAAILYLMLTGQDLTPETVTNLTPLSYFALLVKFTFTGGGLGEELGWRGFMLPYLQNRLKINPLKAAIYIGIAHSFWHFPVYGFATIFFTVFAVALSVIMVWIFNNTKENVMLMILMHGSVNASLSFMEDLWPSLDNNMVVVMMVMMCWAIVAYLVKDHIHPPHKSSYP